MGTYCKGPFLQQRLLQSQICIYEQTGKGWAQGKTCGACPAAAVRAQQQAGVAKPGLQQCWPNEGYTETFSLTGSSSAFMSCLVKRTFKNQDNLPDADSIYPSA